MNYIHASQMIFNTPLLVEERKKNVITNVFLKRLEGQKPDTTAYEDDDWDRPKRPGKLYHRMGDVAILPIQGTLVHRQFGMEALSGMTSYQTIAAMFTQAMEDTSVRKILLDIDSGGGQVAGLFDLVDMIVEARKEKTIWAFSNECAFSAAYAIASAAEKIFVSRTSGVGSIGVVMQHVDISRLNDEMGITITPIYAGDKKIDWSENFPLSPEAFASGQKEVNDVYDIFVKTVAENRGIDEDDVRSTQAGLFYGADAVQVNLADDVSSFDQVLESFISVGTAVEVPIVSKMGKLKMRLFGKMAKDKPTAEVVDTDAPEVPATPETPAEPAPADAPEADAPAPAEDPAEETAEQPPADEPTAVSEADAPADPADVVQAAIDAGQPDLAVALIKQKATSAQVKDRLDASAEINRLCKMAGVPSKAADFIQKNLTVQAVKDSLLETLAARSDKSDVSPNPDPEKVAETLKTADKAINPVMADAERRQKEWEKRKSKGV